MEKFGGGEKKKTLWLCLRNIDFPVCQDVPLFCASNDTINQSLVFPGEEDKGCPLFMSGVSRVKHSLGRWRKSTQPDRTQELSSNVTLQTSSERKMPEYPPYLTNERSSHMHDCCRIGSIWEPTGSVKLLQ